MNGFEFLTDITAILCRFLKLCAVFFVLEKYATFVKSALER